MSCWRHPVLHIRQVVAAVGAEPVMNHNAVKLILTGTDAAVSWMGTTTDAAHTAAIAAALVIDAAAVAVATRVAVAETATAVAGVAVDQTAAAAAAATCIAAIEAPAAAHVWLYIQCFTECDISANLRSKYPIESFEMYHQHVRVIIECQLLVSWYQLLAALTPVEPTMERQSFQQRHQHSRPAIPNHCIQVTCWKHNAEHKGVLHAE